MEYLFDSRGNHIANLVAGSLHAPDGKHVGEFLKGDEIFIDRKGKYLGELVQGNRLMCHTNSCYQSTNFGRYGNVGNIGNYGNPGRRGTIGRIAGYEDIDISRLVP